MKKWQIVKLINVSKTYEGGNTAVKSVNVEIKDKEFVVLVGSLQAAVNQLLFV